MTCSPVPSLPSDAKSEDSSEATQQPEVPSVPRSVDDTEGEPDTATEKKSALGEYDFYHEDVLDKGLRKYYLQVRTTFIIFFVEREAVSIVISYIS